MEAAGRVNGKTLWALAFAALMYATVRFVEAYGLWKARAWAEWFALLSGAMYLPWEIIELLRRPTHVRWAIFVINLMIVIYMLYFRISAYREDQLKGSKASAAEVTAAADV